MVPIDILPVTALLEYYRVTVLLESLTSLLEYLDVSNGIVQIAANPALRSLWSL